MAGLRLAVASLYVSAKSLAISFARIGATEARSANSIEATSCALGLSESKRSEVCCNVTAVVTLSTATPPDDLSISYCFCNTSMSFGSSNVELMLAAFAKNSQPIIAYGSALIGGNSRQRYSNLPAK
jgi:hypothetical protein